MGLPGDVRQIAGSLVLWILLPCPDRAEFRKRKKAVL